MATVAEAGIQAGEWLSRSEMARFLDTSMEHVSRLALANKLSVRTLPGTHPKYSRSSAVALLEVSTRSQSL